MPFELWQCIFIALYRSVPIAHRPHVLRTLTGVCQDWKAVALASPELWTAIPAINIFEGMDTKVEVNLTRRFLAQTKRYLDLSGVLPVDLTIHLHRNARPPVNPMAPELIEFLVRHSKRWRSVDAEVPHEMVYHLAGAEGRIPYLERLRLSTFEKVFGDRELSTKPKKFLIDCFSVAPRLHTVEIGIDVAFNETTNFPKVKILLPFHQLQSFTILTTYRTTFYEDMCASPTNLRTLIIHAHYTASNPSHTAFPTATLPRLERLVYQIHSAPVLLESLTLPSLTDLSIPVAPITVQSISNLIVRSHCSLQRLVLGAFVRAQSDAWRELLSRLDTVTHLDLLDPRVKHLKLLVMAPSICNLPNLQYLTFRNVERGYSDWDSDRTLRTFAGVFNSRSVKASEESGLFQPLRQVAFKWAKEDKMLKSMWRLESFLYSPNPTDELEMDRDSGELLNELASKAAKVLRGAKRLYALERRSNHARSRVGWNELPGEEPPMSKEDVELDLVLQKMESIDPTDVRLTWFLVRDPRIIKLHSARSLRALYLSATECIGTLNALQLLNDVPRVTLSLILTDFDLAAGRSWRGGSHSLDTTILRHPRPIASSTYLRA